MIKYKNENIYIHICAIIKNEEEVLERMLKSWSVLQPDTFEIFDTGSTDRTFDILRQHQYKMNIRIKTGEFKSFVESFNELLECVYEKYAGMDSKHFVIFTAADEYIDEAMKYGIIHNILLMIDNNIGTYSITINDITEGKVTTEYMQKRVWYIHPENLCFFKGPYTHEYIDTGSFNHIEAADIILKHEHKKSKNYIEREHQNIANINRYLEENGKNDLNIYMRALFYLGQSYKIVGEYDKSIETNIKYIEEYCNNSNNYSHQSERFNAAYNIALCYMYKKDYEIAVDWFLYCNEIYIDYEQRKEPFYWVAKIYIEHFQNIEKALETIKKANEIINKNKSKLMFYDTQINEVYVPNLLMWLESEQMDCHASLAMTGDERPVMPYLIRHPQRVGDTASSAV